MSAMADQGSRGRTDVAAMLDPRVVDPEQRLVNIDGMDADEIAQVVRVLTAVREWREAEQRISLESRSHMKVGDTDMRALRYLIAQKNQGVIATPGALAEHLGISTASTTKLLDRLERSGHIVRSPHPSDRRALAITITQNTHEEVRDVVGRRHAGRFDAAARLTPAERETVIRFLGDLSRSDERAEEQAGS
jgi:DNA-binding MarR family transcriptional regulator